jgi:hypothetical protein
LDDAALEDAPFDALLALADALFAPTGLVFVADAAVALVAGFSAVDFAAVARVVAGFSASLFADAAAFVVAIG